MYHESACCHRPADGRQRPVPEANALSAMGADSRNERCYFGRNAAVSEGSAPREPAADDGRKTLLLADDRDDNFEVDFRMQRHRHLVVAHFLDRPAVEVNFGLGEFVTGRVHGIANILDADGTKELAFFADLAHPLHRGAAHFLATRRWCARSAKKASSLVPSASRIFA